MATSPSVGTSLRGAARRGNLREPGLSFTGIGTGVLTSRGPISGWPGARRLPRRSVIRIPALLCFEPETRLAILRSPSSITPRNDVLNGGVVVTGASGGVPVHRAGADSQRQGASFARMHPAWPGISFGSGDPESAVRCREPSSWSTAAELGSSCGVDGTVAASPTWERGHLARSVCANTKPTARSREVRSSSRARRTTVVPAEVALGVISPHKAGIHSQTHSASPRVALDCGRAWRELLAVI